MFDRQLWKDRAVCITTALALFTAQQLLLQKKGARAKRAGPSGSLEPEDQPAKAGRKRKAPLDAPGVVLGPPPPRISFSPILSILPLTRQPRDALHPLLP